MKVLVAAVVALMAIAAVRADCGCLKCSKNLYVASPPTSPVQVIYSGASCSCNREIPYKVEQPIIQAPRPVTLRDSTYSCVPLRIVKKAQQVRQGPLYSYDYRVQVPVPVQEKRCNRCLVGLVAQPDRVVIQAPTGCREPVPTNPSRGPVFEALSNVEDEDYLYQYPTQKCSCGRYKPLDSHTVKGSSLGKVARRWPKVEGRFHDGYRELTQEEVDNNVDRNIQDVFFEDTLQGRMRRLFLYGLDNLQRSIKEEPVDFSNVTLSLGKIKFGFPLRRSGCSERPDGSGIRSRAKRSAPEAVGSRSGRVKRALWPFLAPQRVASNHSDSVEAASSRPTAKTPDCSVRAQSREKRALDDLAFTFEEEDNHIPHGDDESYEEYYALEEGDAQEDDAVEDINPMLTMPKASNLLVGTLRLDQLLPQIPLLFFVNAPISMLAHLHKMNKHFEPVVQSVPMVIRTSGRYFNNFGNNFKRSFFVFTNRLMSTINDFAKHTRMRRSPLERFEVVNCKINQDGSVDFVLFNHTPENKLKDLALVIENFTLDATKVDDVRMYLAKVDTTSLAHGTKEKQDEQGIRTKRDIFEVDLNGDIQELFREKWGHLADNHVQSAESIFEDHFDQIPKLHDALRGNTLDKPKKLKKAPKSKSKIRADPILGTVDLFTTSRKKHENFVDLHPEKNLDIIKLEISTVLARLQALLHADIEKDLKFYEDLVKLQYLKNTLIMDWRKYLSGDQGQVVSAKMNILNYIKELEKFRGSLTRKDLNLLMSQPAGDAYNRSDLIKFLVELYKLQMIFTRIHEDLDEKIRLGSRFNHHNEATFIRQLEKVQFVGKTNKFELEQRLKEIRDAQVANNMNLLEKLRKLSELDDSVEMEHDVREEVHDAARMIKENAHYKRQELQQAKEIYAKVKLNQTYRRELKTLWDLERHILENEGHLMKMPARGTPQGASSEVPSIEGVSKEEDSESLEKFDILKMAKPVTLKPLEFKELKELTGFKPNLEWEKEIKSKMDEFAKDVEDKRKAWVKKTKKLAEIMKEP